MEQFNEVLQGILLAAKPAILAIVYMLAAKYLVDILGGILGGLADKIIALRDKINENETMAKIKVDDLILDRLYETVIGVKDSLVDSLKDASADGKLTKEEAKAAADKALEAFKASLSKDELSTLMRVAGEDFMTLVAARLPGVVALSKQADIAKSDDGDFH